jgi:Uma2 family endonuclease
MGVAKKLRNQPATIADLFAIPEDERRHELIDGELIEKGAVTRGHGRAQTRTVLTLGGRFDRRPGGRWPGGWWFATEVEIIFSHGNVLRPDIVGWRRERAPEPDTSSPISLVPDWVCEILSTNWSNDLVKKKRIYHQDHVPHYWILDPVEHTLAVQRWSPDGYTEVLSAQRGERVRAEPFDAVELAVEAFFEDEEPDE